MSKIQVYQICYLKEQLEKVKLPFVPYNNLENLHPELCEYQSFEPGQTYALQHGLDLWGFVSPKFEAKTNITGQQFIDFIEIDPNRADVYFINPTPINESLSPSVITQGENCHPGLKDLIQRNLNKMHISVDLNKLWMDSETFALCNYFVGNKIFWKQYIDFLKFFIDMVKTDSADYDMMFKTAAHYGPNAALPYFTFVVERLFSVFINTNHNIKVEHYRYTRDELLNKTKLPPHILDELRSLSDIKTAAISGGRHELLEHYIFYRNRLAQANPYLFNLE
jgi:hypothetical protein